MDLDTKVRIGFLLVPLTIAAFAAMASAHGFALGILDEIGGGVH
jgi:hypothetical protein